MSAGHEVRLPRDAAAAGEGKSVNRWRSARRKAWAALRVVAVWTAAAGGLIALANLMLRSGVDPRSVHVWLLELRPWGIGLQVVGTALLLWRWPAVVAWLARTGRAQPHHVPELLAWRPRLTLLVVSYLLLVPIGPVALWQLLQLWHLAAGGFGLGHVVR